MSNLYVQEDHELLAYAVPSMTTVVTCHLLKHILGRLIGKLTDIAYNIVQVKMSAEILPCQPSIAIFPAPKCLNSHHHLNMQQLPAQFNGALASTEIQVLTPVKLCARNQGHFECKLNNGHDEMTNEAVPELTATYETLAYEE